MNLKIKNQAFVVGGAGSGFGKAIATMLLQEGAHILAIGRTQSKLVNLASEYPDRVAMLAADITIESTHDYILRWMKTNQAVGCLINAGGPPAGTFEQITLSQWDEAYRSVFRWKIALMQRVIPYMQEKGYGRLLFIESVSVKQPVNNLILSNALRAAVVGAVKTISHEVAKQGVTANILAPGYHATAAMERLFLKKSELEKISIDQAKELFEAEIPVGPMGKPEEMASLALWLLSPLSRYVTGQTFSHDGGLIAGVFG